MLRNMRAITVERNGYDARQLLRAYASKAYERGRIG
jgi:hypothetical protein